MNPNVEIYIAPNSEEKASTGLFIDDRYAKRGLFVVVNLWLGQWFGASKS